MKMKLLMVLGACASLFWSAPAKAEGWELLSQSWYTVTYNVTDTATDITIGTSDYDPEDPPGTAVGWAEGLSIATGSEYGTEGIFVGDFSAAFVWTSNTAPHLFWLNALAVYDSDASVDGDAAYSWGFTSVDGGSGGAFSSAWDPGQLTAWDLDNEPFTYLADNDWGDGETLSGTLFGCEVSVGAVHPSTGFMSDGRASLSVTMSPEDGITPP